MQREYQVIVDHVNFNKVKEWDTETFDSKVNQALGEGWLLQGGVTSVGLDEGTQLVLMQAVVRDRV